MERAIFQRHVLREVVQSKASADYRASDPWERVTVGGSFSMWPLCPPSRHYRPCGAATAAFPEHATQPPRARVDA